MSHFKLYVILTVHSLHHLQTADVHHVLCTAEVSSLYHGSKGNRIIESNNRRKKARIVHLEKMIKHDDRSVTVNPNTHQDLFSIMQHHHNEITKAFPENSFPYIFWMSQYKAATKDDSHRNVLESSND